MYSMSVFYNTIMANKSHLERPGDILVESITQSPAFTAIADAMKFRTSMAL